MWTLMRDYATVRRLKTGHSAAELGDDGMNGGKARILIVDERAVAQEAARSLANAGSVLI